MILLQVLPALTDVTVYVDLLKELGVAGVALVLMYNFSKYVANSSFEKVNEANQNAKEASARAENSQKEFKEFLQKEYIKNQLIIENLTNTFEDHIKSKEKSLELIERLIQDKNVPNDYRQYFKK
jgi:uncharacterized protein YlxW (UPF0749 family)